MSSPKERAYEKYESLVSNQSDYLTAPWSLSISEHYTYISLNNHVVYSENINPWDEGVFTLTDTCDSFRESFSKLSTFLEEHKSLTVVPRVKESPWGEANMLEMADWRVLILEEVASFNKELSYELIFSLGKRLGVWEFRFGEIALITEFDNTYGQEGYNGARENFIHYLRLLSEA